MKRKWFPGCLGGWLVVGLLLTGCASSCPDILMNLMKSLTFLSLGVTTRADVIARLGPPAGASEGERIQTYRLWGDGCPVSAPRGWTPGADGEPAAGCLETRLSPPGEPPGEVAPPALRSRHKEQFSLVLVFDAQGRLAGHRLLRVHPGHQNVLDKDEAARVLDQAKGW